VHLRVKNVTRQLLLTLLLHAAALASVQGSIVLDRTDADLGFVYRDEPQTLVFEFTNASKNTLEVLEIEPSCDCTTAQLVPEAVGSGSRGKFLVFFDPMGYEGRGRFKEFVRVITTDPQTPEIMLNFSAEVGIGPEAEPRALAFGKVCRGESDTLGLAIHPVRGTALEVLDAYSDTACILVESLGSDPSGAHEFRVVATNQEGCSRLAGFVTVVTDDTLRSRLRVPVTVSFVGRIVADPDLVAFGPTLPGTYVAQAVKISSKGGLKFSVPEIICTIDQLEPALRRLDEHTCELRLKVREGAQSGRVSGEVILKTDCPDEPPIEIKVTGYIRSSR
jgi:hypothetical protein